MVSWYPLTLRRAGEKGEPGLLGVSSLDDELVGSLLCASGLVTKSGLAPRGNRSGTSNRGLTLPTTVRVDIRVHDRTTNCRANAQVTGSTSLTEVYVLVIEVRNGTDGSHAVNCNVSQLAAGKADQSHAVLLSHELSHVAGRTNHLSALTGVHLDVVDNGTNGDISQCKSVAGLDISVAAGTNGIAYLKSVGSDDISLLAILVSNESDESRSVRIVLESGNSSVHALLVSLEVDNAVLLSVAAADVSNGDSTVAVTAGSLLNGLQK